MSKKSRMKSTLVSNPKAGPRKLRKGNSEVASRNNFECTSHEWFPHVLRGTRREMLNVARSLTRRGKLGAIVSNVRTGKIIYPHSEISVERAY